MLDEFHAAAPARPATGNTVLGQPEPLFRKAWIHILSRAMLKSGKGFRLDPIRRTRDDRRPDKIGTTKLSRRLMAGVV